MDNWKTPEDLISKLPPVPTFELDLLPASLGPMVSDVASRMQVPVDFPAIVAVATLAGVCGRRAAIQPKALDDSWIVVPNLWGAIVADAGMMKSPVIKAVTSVAQSVEKQWRSEYEARLQAHGAEKRRWTLKHEVWDKKYKKHLETRTPGDPETPPDSPEPGSEPKSPAQRRLMTTDATLESLHKLLEQNPAGIFVLRDELTGWLTSLEKIGRESERAFYLECWNGDSSFTLDRIGRGSVYVENCCVSLFGGLQPSRLRSYFEDAIEDRSQNDGLIQRFQLLIWPDKLPGWSYKDQRRDADAFKKAEEAYRGIAELDSEKQLRMKFSEDAQQFFVEWLTKLMSDDLQNDDLHPSLESHFSKYRSLMPSLALLLSLADSNRDLVDLKYAEQAARWCKYLMGHAHRVYASRISPAHSAALILSKKLEKGKLGDREGRFSLRDVYRSGWRELSTPDQARAALRVLEDYNWVRPEVDTDVPWERERGRPSETYETNPAIMERIRGSEPPSSLDHQTVQLAGVSN
jgi:predicted transcriptional regulator